MRRWREIELLAVAAQLAGKSDQALSVPARVMTAVRKLNESERLR
jgi:hypothetical protein